MTGALGGGQPAVGQAAAGITVFPDLDEVQGDGWPDGATITLEIDDPDDGLGDVDYTAQTTSHPGAEPGPDFTFLLVDDFDVQPGDEITVTDDTTTKTHTVTDLTVTTVDVDGDTVSGTAVPGTEVRVAYDPGQPVATSRTVPVDPSGIWTADFSVPGDAPDEQDVFDIPPGLHGRAHQDDPDGDTTAIDWNAPPPPNTPPTALVAVDFQSPQVGQEVHFDGSASSDSDGTVDLYEWDLDGDGIFETNTGSTASASHTYGSPGTITVQLRVTDNGGLSDQDSVILSVENPPPPPTGTLTGTVLDADSGQPFSDTTGVTICPGMTGNPGCPGGQFAFAGAAGVYGNDLAPGTYSIQAFTFLDQVGVSVPFVIVQVNEGATTVHNFTIDVLPRIVGTITDGNGNPPPQPRGVFACPSTVPLAFGCPGMIGASTFTLDGSPKYALVGLAPGTTYNVTSFGGVGSAFIGGPAQTYTLGPTDIVTKNWLFDSKIEGDVTDLDNTGVSGADVRVVAGPIFGPATLTTTDGAGHFQTPYMPAGTYTLQIIAPPSSGLGARTVTVNLDAAEIRDIGVIKLGPAIEVDGTVLDGNGNPFSGVNSGGALCPAPSVPSLPGCPGQAFDFADTDGTFSMSGIEPGTYNVVGFVFLGPGFTNLVSTPPVSVTVTWGDTVTCNFTVTPPSGGSGSCSNGTDSDGVSDAVENGAPNNGDGNSDGTPDAQQANVASLPNAVNGQYVSIESADGTNVSNVQALPVPASPTPPAGATFPIGLLHFEVQGVTPGGTITAEVHMAAGSSPTGYFKLHDGAWLDYSSNAAIAGDLVTLTLTDGAVGDDDGVANGTIVDPGGPAVLPFTLTGFFPPVDNLPTLNAVNAGQAVPVKFSLGGDQGLDIFADGYPKSEEIECTSTTLVDGVEQTVTAGESSLSYDATTDQYTYVWKTSKNWAPGTCRQLVLTLSDGSVHRANFKLK